MTESGKRELYEERAAIKQYLGNMSREQAEREASREIYGTEIPHRE